MDDPIPVNTTVGGQYFTIARSPLEGIAPGLV
jgi:hypothetical protein